MFYYLLNLDVFLHYFSLSFSMDPCWPLGVPWLPVWKPLINVFVDERMICVYVYIYIYAFSRRFYPKQQQNSGYTFFCQYVCSLGIKPTTFCAADKMLYHWATGTQETGSVCFLLDDILFFLSYRYSFIDVCIPIYFEHFKKGPRNAATHRPVLFNQRRSVLSFLSFLSLSLSHWLSLALCLSLSLSLIGFLSLSLSLSLYLSLIGFLSLSVSLSLSLSLSISLSLAFSRSLSGMICFPDSICTRSACFTMHELIKRFGAFFPAHCQRQFKR